MFTPAEEMSKQEISGLAVQISKYNISTRAKRLSKLCTVKQLNNYHNSEAVQQLSNTSSASHAIDAICCTVPLIQRPNQ